MLDEKFITALNELGPMSALVLVVLVLVWLLWAILKWVKERDAANEEHVKTIMVAYSNLNTANEGMIKRVEGLATQDQEYASKIERTLRDERMERQEEIALLRAEIADLRVDNKAQSARITELEAQLKEKQAAFDELEGKFTSMQKQRDNLRKELTAVQTQNAVMSAQISRLEEGRDTDPEPPTPVKSAPRPRLVTKGNGKEEVKDVVDLGEISEVKDEDDVEDVA